MLRPFFLNIGLTFAFVFYISTFRLMFLDCAFKWGVLNGCHFACNFNYSFCHIAVRR